jgi:hypothetical protein
MNAARNQICPCGSGKKYRNCCGRTPSKKRPRKQRAPEPANVAGYYVDEESKKVFVVTKDVLLKQIHRDCPRIARSFDKLAQNDLTEISTVLGQAMSIVAPQYYLRIGEDKELLAVCSRLLNHSMTTFIAAIEMARRGFRKQYGSLVRDVIETLSTVLYLCRIPSALQQYLDGKLKSSKTIAAAGQVIPEYGKLYGMLSNQFVHINKFHERLGDLAEYQENDEALSFILPNMRLTSWLIYVVSEFAFIESVGAPRYFKVIAPSMIAYDPSDEEREWMKEFFHETEA